MKKNKSAQDLQKLSTKKQKLDPNYNKKMRERSKLAVIARAIKLLHENNIHCC